MLSRDLSGVSRRTLLGNTNSMTAKTKDWLPHEPKSTVAELSQLFNQ
jgi:hypothetical protein